MKIKENVEKKTPVAPSFDIDDCSTFFKSQHFPKRLATVSRYLVATGTGSGALRPFFAPGPVSKEVPAQGISHAIGGPKTGYLIVKDPGKNQYIGPVPRTFTMNV